MAKPREIIERIYLRYLRGDALSGEPGADRLLNALRVIEEKEELIGRLKETEKRRAAIHHKLKKRLHESRGQAVDLRDENRKLGREIERLELEGDALKRRVEAQGGTTRVSAREAALTERVTGTAWWFHHVLGPAERYAWRYPMRMGVLYQHDPREVRWDDIPAPDVSDEALPKMSVVVPSYNQAEFLGEAMESILSQGYPDLEVVVMDGGSTDGSRETIERHADRLAYWRSETDDGQAAAINDGFAKTDGEIMAWLNSDDRYCPGVLRHVGAYFAQHPEVDAVYGHRIVIDDDGREVGRWVMPRHDREMIYWMDYIPQETLFWRRRLWEEAGPVDTDCLFAIDWDLLIRFQRAKAKIVRLPYFTGCFRAHEAQKSQVMIDAEGQQDYEAFRVRELGSEFTEARLRRRVVAFQLRAILHAKLLGLGLRW